MSLETSFSPNYLESIAQSDFPEGKAQRSDIENDLKEEKNQPRICGYWAILGECENGHKFAKALDCGQEWCPICKETSHRRRFSRWLSKAMKIKKMAYLVVAPPSDKMPRGEKEKYQVRIDGKIVIKERLVLSGLAIRITKILKRKGYDRGFRRMHPFGSKTNNYQPHFNFLFEGGWLNDSELRSLKKEIREVLGIPETVIYYQYTEEVGKIIHWLKYVTRATFLKKWWDEEMAEALHNFKNTVSWGTWTDEDKWGLPDHEKIYGYVGKIENSVCPCCNAKIHWTRAVHIDELKELDYQQIWLKVWQIRPPPEKVLIFDLLRAFDRG